MNSDIFLLVIVKTQWQDGDPFLQEQGPPQRGDVGSRGDGLHLHVWDPVQAPEKEVRHVQSEIFQEQFQPRIQQELVGRDQDVAGAETVKIALACQLEVIHII